MAELDESSSGRSSGEALRVGGKGDLKGCFCGQVSSPTDSRGSRGQLATKKTTMLPHRGATTSARELDLICFGSPALLVQRNMFKSGNPSEITLSSKQDALA